MVKKNMDKKTDNIDRDSEWKALLENEAEANQYAAKCLAVCAGVGALAWLFNLLGIFIIPAKIMNIGMPFTILFFLLPALLCKLTGGTPLWLKYVIVICGIISIFILSSAMPKHGVLAWAVPLALSCHYYSKKLTKLTLISSWVLFSASIYLGMYIGEGDLNLLVTEPVIENRVITGKMLYEASLFFVFPRALILLGLSSICTTVAGRTRRLLEKQIKDSEERQRISTELDVATRIQADMLPCIFPAFPDRPEFDIYASMNPAKEVGGDFYDFFMVDETHLALVIADVSGKGVPAALFMVIGKTLIRDHTRLFISAFEGILNLVTGEFRFVNAGHELPFIAKSGGTYEPHKLRAGFVLAGMENTKYQSGSIQLSPGDKIFQYTDGVTEATNKDHELYGMKRLADILAQNTDKKPAELLPAIKADIDAFVGEAPQFDDITMLCVEYLHTMDA